MVVLGKVTMDVARFCVTIDWKDMVFLGLQSYPGNRASMSTPTGTEYGYQIEILLTRYADVNQLTLSNAFRSAAIVD